MTDSIPYFRKLDLPLAQILVSNDEQKYFPQLKSLLQELNSGLDNEQAERAVFALIASEEFLALYYFLSNAPAGLALYHFKDYLFKGAYRLPSIVRKLVSSLYPIDGPVILKSGINIVDDEFERVVICVWEILVNSLKPEIDSNTAIQQYELLDYYWHIQSHIKAGDYNEADLAELNRLMFDYLQNKIDIQRLLTILPQLSIYNNRYASQFYMYAQEVPKYGYISPKVAIYHEVVSLNTKIREDQTSTRLFRNKELNKDAAVDFLRVYESQLSSEEPSPDNLALIFERMEFIIRDGIYFDQDLDDDFPADIPLAFDILLQAAKEINLPGLSEFLEILSTTWKIWEYEFQLAKGPNVPDAVKGAMVLVMINKLSVRYINVISKNVVYKQLIEGLRAELPKLLDILSGISDYQIRLRSAVRITNMLAKSMVHGDSLKEFLDTHADGLIGSHLELFKSLAQYWTLQNPIVKEWLASKEV